jgi:hypothetical protein
MKRLLYGLAALPLLAGVALAQEPAKGPMPLTNQQMDTVTAGWDLLEIDQSNTSLTAVAIYQRPSNVIACASCYLLINNPAISVASMFGHP